MIELSIGSNEAGQRFDKYLKKLLKNAPDSFLYKMLRKKNIVLNGSRASGSEKLNEGDEVKLFLSDETYKKFRGSISSENCGIKPERTASDNNGNCKKSQSLSDIADGNGEAFIKAYNAVGSLPVVYENRDILVINKPAGLLSQKSAAGDLSVNEWFIGYMLVTGQISARQLATFKPSICNRLDRNTSGLMICGKTLLGIQYADEIIKTKELKKFYYCLVCGEAVMDMRCTGYLYKDKRSNRVNIYASLDEISPELRQHADYIDTSFRTVRTVKEEDFNASPAKTAFSASPTKTAFSVSLIESALSVSLIEAELHTGKAHQIRAHLSSIGHPIIGDFKYSDAKSKKISEALGVKYQLLHAHKLVFPVITPEMQLKYRNIDEGLSGLVLECGMPEIFDEIMQIPHKT